MIKKKQVEAIKSICSSEGTVNTKLNAIISIAIDQKNDVLSIFLDPTLNLDEKLFKIQESVKLSEQKIRKYRKYAQLIGTLCLVVYTFLQTIGLI